jgi:hypothetical protein
LNIASNWFLNAMLNNREEFRSDGLLRSSLIPHGFSILGDDRVDISYWMCKGPARTVAATHPKRRQTVSLLHRRHHLLEAWTYLIKRGVAEKNHRILKNLTDIIFRYRIWTTNGNNCKFNLVKILNFFNPSDLICD